MTGKVFEDSSNIYQDQAKVLFDYYKKAAEKIVGEEKFIEQNIEDLKVQKAEAERKSNLYKILMWALCWLLGIPLLIFWMMKKKQDQLIVELDQELVNQDEKYRNIRRDYGVNKIGVCYVPVATRVPFEGKSFLIDHTRKVDETNFQLTVLNQPKEFSEALDKLQSGMEKMPIVEGNEMPEEVDTSNYSTSVQNVTLHDYVGNIDRQVRSISYLLNDNEKISVSLPIIKPKSSEETFVEEYATQDTNNKPVVNVFDIDDFDSKLENFASLNSMKNQIKNSGDGDNAEYMKKLMVQLAETVQLLTNTKSSGASKLLNYTSKIFENVLKSSYNQYSPSIEAEEIERIRQANFDYQTSVNDYKPFELKQGSRVKYDLISDNWVAEDGSRTSMPFGMHQVDEEVLMPVIQNLMEENRIERLKIYNNIEDQKREYLEKWTSETGAYFRDNRKTADELITHMREAFADYSSSATTYKSLMKTQEMLDSQGVGASAKVEAEDAQEEMIAGFEVQANQCNAQQEQFAEFMDRIQEDINDSKERFAHVEYYEASLRDGESHDMAVSMSNVQNLDPRKKQLVGVSPYFANNAVVPPLPTTMPEMMQDLDIDLNRQVATNLQSLEEITQEAVAAAENAAQETVQMQTQEENSSEETPEPSATDTTAAPAVENDQPAPAPESDDFDDEESGDDDFDSDESEENDDEDIDDEDFDDEDEGEDNESNTFTVTLESVEEGMEDNLIQTLVNLGASEDDARAVVENCPQELITDTDEETASQIAKVVEENGGTVSIEGGN